MSSGDPSPLEQRLREALAEEYADEPPHYDQATCRHRGRVSAQYHLPIVIRALQRAGLRLAEGHSGENDVTI